MIEVLAVIVVFGTFILSMFLGRTIFTKWLDHKYGSGSTELYLKNVKESNEEAMIAVSGFLFLMAFFLILTSAFLVFSFIPYFIRSGNADATLSIVLIVVIILAFFTAKGAIGPYIRAKKWFSIPEEVRFSEEFTDSFKRYNGVEDVIRASSKISVGLYLFVGFIGFVVTAFICLPFRFLLPFVYYPIWFVIMAIGAGFSVWFFTPSGILYLLKRRFSKLGDVNDIFEELNQQGETIADTAPYTLRISPNYVFLSGKGYSNYIWRRQEIRCYEKLYCNSEMMQNYLDMTQNGKALRIPISGKNMENIVQAICQACGKLETEICEEE